MKKTFILLLAEENFYQLDEIQDARLEEIHLDFATKQRGKIKGKLVIHAPDPDTCLNHLLTQVQKGK